MHRAFLRLSIVAILLSAAAVFAGQEPAEILTGTWQGAWYRGMTSGQMTLEVKADGSGTVTFTNLETFGEEPAPLARARFTGSQFQFSAAAGSRGAFAGRMEVPDGANQLRGDARYDGFPVTFELGRIR
jgi:hypothetical protein